MVKSTIVKGLIKKAKPKGMLKAKPKAGMVARRNMLRGATTAEKFGKTMKDPSRLKQTKKKPLIGKTQKGIGIGVAGTLAYQELRKGKKSEAKTTKKLKKSIEKHKEKDKKKKEKKHHSR